MLIPCVICQPRTTQPKESPVEKTILDKAANHLPSAIKRKVCRLKEENVVNPPQTPTTSNCVNAMERLLFDMCTRRPEKMPTRMEPTTFTKRVPKGKVSPNR